MDGNCYFLVNQASTTSIYFNIWTMKKKDTIEESWQNSTTEHSTSSEWLWKTLQTKWLKALSKKVYFEWNLWNNGWQPPMFIKKKFAFLKVRSYEKKIHLQRKITNKHTSWWIVQCLKHVFSTCLVVVVIILSPLLLRFFFEMNILK